MVNACHLHNSGTQVAFLVGTLPALAFGSSNNPDNYFIYRRLHGTPTIASGIQSAHLRTSSPVLRGRRVTIDSLREGQHLEQLQRRRSPRIRLQIPVFLRGSDTSGVEFIELTKTLNIGSAGACIASTHILMPDQIVYLTVPAPSPVPSSLVPHETPPIAAKILRQELAGEMRLFGLEFLRPLE
jgi:hypothetical protein